MSYHPAKHHRRSIRLRACDYSYAGEYFVTICAAGRKCLFGKIEAGNVILSSLGNVVEKEWQRTALLRPYVWLDKYVVMPNHFHGILIIAEDGRGTARRAPTTEQYGKPVRGSVPTIMRAFRSAVTNEANDSGLRPPRGVWQGGYFEHIIRSSARGSSYTTFSSRRSWSTRPSPGRKPWSMPWVTGITAFKASRSKSGCLTIVLKSEVRAFRLIL